MLLYILKKKISFLLFLKIYLFYSSYFRDDGRHLSGNTLTPAVFVETEIKCFKTVTLSRVLIKKII